MPRQDTKFRQAAPAPPVATMVAPMPRPAPVTSAIMPVTSMTASLPSCGDVARCRFHTRRYFGRRFDSIALMTRAATKLMTK
jgi:hypothetical protein